MYIEKEQELSVVLTTTTCTASWGFPGSFDDQVEKDQPHYLLPARTLQKVAVVIEI